MQKEDNRLIKHSGQVFTPNYLVKTILDFASYNGGKILRKNVIDNSCGDGAFLCEIVERYIKEYQAVMGNMKELKYELETFIHGIELDNEAFKNCLYNLNAISEQYGIDGVEWDILHENALNVYKYDNSMDYVVGNPPYVRVHNLDDEYNNVKRFSFAKDGMTDLYLVFYELGLRYLNNTGKLCYITPSSWLTSVAATNMRRYILEHKTLVAVVDLGHYQAFEDATTYTMITLFETEFKGDTIKYHTYSPAKKEEEYVCDVSYEEMVIGGYFYFAKPKDLSMLREMKSNNASSLCSVKNGFATLADKVFILDVKFEKLTIPILKASTGKWYKGFFPYDTNGKPLSKEEIFSHPEIAEYLNKNKENLLKNKKEESCPEWYLYGRTQALKDVYVDKYAINTVIRSISSIRLEKVPKGKGLYSGLYILTQVPYELLEQVIKSDDFISYIQALKKYKSGGYYTFNSKDLEQYLNLKLMQYGTYYKKKANKCRFSEGNLPLF